MVTQLLYAVDFYYAIKLILRGRRGWEGRKRERKGIKIARSAKICNKILGRK